MQILKTEVRNRIIESAIDEFSSLGYEKSSLRQIAKHSGITVGNIYAYFRDKSALLDSILEPVLLDVNTLIDEFALKRDDSQDYLHTVAARVVQLYHKYRRQVIILMSMMNNEKYSIYRKRFVDYVAKSILDDVPSVKDARLSKIIAESVMSGIITCFKDIPSLNKEDAIELVYEYLYFMFHVAEVR